MLGGLSLLDYDQDGFLDIFFTNGAAIPSLAKKDASFHNRLYRNNGDGAFTDVTAKAGVAGAGYSIGATAGDYDNDGYPDLYVAGVNVNTLYRNNRDGTFTDVTEAAGVGGRLASGKKAWSIGGAWLDYDNDGDLDLFVVNYIDWSVANNRLCGDPGKRLSCSPVMYTGLPNILYRNDGNGKFTDVSASTGIAEHIGKGMGMAVADYDNDGYMDIFVGNDTERNFLFRNERGARFSEVGVEAGVAFGEDGIPISSMGVDFRDVNNDGLPDVSISALASETFPLFLNSKHGYFNDATYRSGIGTSSLTTSGWGNGIFDFDNDGFKDIFTAGCHVSENIEQYRHERYKLPNSVWQNLGGGRFRTVSEQAGFTLESAAAHHGAAFGDLDNDGRVDAVVSVIGGKAEILMNVSTREHNWIALHLEGSASNRDGIGTRIKVTSESGLVQYNHVTTCVGYASSSDRRAHFGLGRDRKAREIELLWPSGKRQVLRDVEANRILKVQEE
ncbi:MAG: CRTAC1 family protein [Bryobacteraceae bacterium]|nr:CRTAC1 family protein [Bryobacteraceae bacterium]